MENIIWDGSVALGEAPGSEFKIIVESKTGIPALLHACHGSRRVVLEMWEKRPKRAVEEDAARNMAEFVAGSTVEGTGRTKS